MRTHHVAPLLSVALALAYLFGFISWNYFLLSFGFFEHNLLQTRFISAGFLFLFFPTVLWLLFLKDWKVKLKQKLEQFDSIQLIIIKLSCLLAFDLYTWIFNVKIFPLTPQNLGGAKPFPITIIVEPEQMDRLRKLDIEFYPSGEKAIPIQSTPLCNLYQNSDFVVLGVFKEFKTKEAPQIVGKARIVTLKRDELVGYVPVPVHDLERAKHEQCTPFIQLGWYYRLTQRP